MSRIPENFARASLTGAIIALMLTITASTAWAGGPLSEADLTKVIALDLGDDAVVAKIAKDGVGFAVDDAAVSRLKAAGASDAVVAAVRQAAARAASVPAAAVAIGYDDVMSLLKLEIPEAQILKRLEKSPTVFTLDAAQVDALKKAGATDALLAAMRGTRKPAAPVGEVTDIAVILDCSGSMTEATPEGPSKMDAARRVVTDLVQKIPDGLGLSFVVYGHDLPQRCEAVQVVRPLGRLDASGKSSLASIIAGVKPVGSTPIALALRTAGGELTKAKGPRGIVLITDGKETCNGNPVAEAAALAASGVYSFGVNVVGFDVSAEERAGLEQISKAGGGKYFNAETATQLRGVIEALNKSIAVAAKPAPVQSVKVARTTKAIKVLPPAIELPPMKDFFAMPAGTRPPFFHNERIATGTKYGVESRVPLGTKATAFDVYWNPVDGKIVRLAENVSFDETGLIEIRPEEKLGLVQVTGSGLPAAESVMACVVGTTRQVFPYDILQESVGFGKTMVVPAGECQIRFKPVGGSSEILAEKLDVPAGKLTKIE